MGAVCLLAGVFGFLGLLEGCTDEFGLRAEGRAALAMVGLSEDDVRDPATVLVLVTTAAGDTGSCSGVVVAPRVVLTAAHCVAPQAVGAGAFFSVFLGDDLGDPAQAALPENSVAVVQTAVDPKFDLTLLQAGHDLATLVTKTPLSVEPLSFEPPPALEGVTSVRVVGFGITDVTDTTGSTAGRRREATIALASFDDRFLELGLDESAPCLGDSGGPVFAQLADASEPLAGIVSFTDQHCGPFSRATRLGAYASWVRERIEESEAPPEGTDGGDPPDATDAGVPGGGDDGGASSGCAIRSGRGSEPGGGALAALAVLATCRAARRRVRASRTDITVRPGPGATRSLPRDAIRDAASAACGTLDPIAEQNS